MALMAVLGLVVALGLLVAFVWGGSEIVPPWAGESQGGPLPVGEALRRYVWYVALALGAGIVSGIVMIGAGGRLAMRLLAATAGEAAQGRITEAEEIVGRITVDGTLGFVIFIGILGGIATGALFVLIHRWLPAGTWRGLIFGALLLVVAGSRIDPLRTENPDFDIVGPGWLAVLIFVALGFGHGLLLAALADRYSRRLPLLSLRVKALAAHAPLLILIPGVALLVPVAAGALFAIAGQSVGAMRSLTPKVLVWGRVLIAVVALVALPGFVSAAVDIAGRA
jgi:hypothetical protein